MCVSFLAYATDGKVLTNEMINEFSAGCVDSINANKSMPEASLTQAKKYCECTTKITLAAGTDEEWTKFSAKKFTRKEAEAFSQKLIAAGKPALQQCKKYLVE
jgi:hypothetical protein